MAAQGLHEIIRELRQRWPKPKEIRLLLNNHGRYPKELAPFQRPHAGVWGFFDRDAVRRFRNDGHVWRKRKDGKAVQESHEKLKIDGRGAINCCYASGEENPNFQRRIYWLLQEEFNRIALVVYREVDNPPLVPPLTEEAGVADNQDLHPNHVEQLIIAGRTPQPPPTDEALFAGLQPLDLGTNFCIGESINYSYGDLDLWPIIVTESPQQHYVNYPPLGESTVAHNDIGMQPEPSYWKLFFTILDYAPGWAFSGVSTKMLIAGSFLKAKDGAGNMKWCCMFGPVEVRAEVLNDFVLRCQVPVLDPGRVPFYITRGDQMPCSEVRDFVYYEKPLDLKESGLWFM